MNKESTRMSVGRIVSLADGIFAIAMTLLVVTIDIPKKGQMISTEGLHRFIFEQYHEILNYILSFILLAAFWTIHHQQFHYIKHTDSKHLWINIMIFMSITLTPFVTSLAGDFPDDLVAQLFFHFNMLAMGILFYLNWFYATKDKCLVESALEEGEITIEKKKLLIIPCAACLAIIISFIRPRVSAYLYLLIPVILSLKRFNIKED
ncbi:MAG: TMEM175 family protein [Candidatus Omnitrophica bacterium]|jgi:uncharacterized membrane protein|nr:TMEM175 family protein [Candidatus Omnitrophota bacterium]